MCSCYSKEREELLYTCKSRIKKNLFKWSKWLRSLFVLYDWIHRKTSIFSSDLQKSQTPSLKSFTSNLKMTKALVYNSYNPEWFPICQEKKEIRVSGGRFWQSLNFMILWCPNQLSEPPNNYLHKLTWESGKAIW